MQTVEQFARKKGLSTVRVYQLVTQGRIRGASKFGPMWAIPGDAVIDPPLKVKHRIKQGKKGFRVKRGATR